MTGNVKDMQKASFQELVTKKIPSMILETKAEIGDYALTFKPMDVSNSILLTDANGTEYNSIKAECTLSMKSTGECVEFNVELLRVPVLHELGFMIKGNYMQQLDIYERAAGWNFYKDKKLGECANLIAENGRSLYFNYGSVGPYVRFLVHGENKKVKVRVSTFLRVLLGCSNAELVSMFGYNNPFVIEAFGAHADERSIDECIKEVARALLNDNDCANSRTVLNLRDEIEEDLLSARYFPLGTSNLARLRYFQSFSCRANGCVLARDVNCNGYFFESGTVLTTDELVILDKLPITELLVRHNQSIYHLRKFSKLSFNVLGCRVGEALPEFGIQNGQILTEADLDSLESSKLTKLRLADGNFVVRRVSASSITSDDVLTAFSIWADNLNGFEQHSKQFEITNRVLKSYDSVIAGMIESNLQRVIQNIKKNLHSIDYSGQLAVCINNCFDGINVNAFIDKISNASNNAGQMSDMCNLMAFAAKSGKAAANMGKASATDEMVQVQDMQEGRLDPLDVPESDKIGSVHYRTLLSKLDTDGNVTAPFLKVRDGEVISDEPVYLTAIEQTDVYVAEWNETFHNADGSLKDRVRVQCNGEVVSVETSKVLYKEMSPYQNLSPAHAMVPFPGHSAGKRITMACNQVKQAVPCVYNERPYTISGGESILKVGFYTAYDVLEQYWAKTGHLLKVDKKTILDSAIKLQRVVTEENSRTLFFEVEAVGGEYNVATLTVPYLLRTFEASMFSYNVNPVKGNVYRGNDVVAVNNGYSLDSKELLKCADFGKQPMSDDVFGKGIALVQNLLVAYKTYGGSAIEDGILISSRLVYDDTLTHIGMFEISDSAVRDKNSSEFFATDTLAPKYLQSNGLPAVGTYLKPGMIAISKIRKTSTKSSTKYTYVPTYVEGQVISSKLVSTQKGLEAVIVLAQRSFVQAGDKLAGRCGNKGVIARIVPETEMPFIKETGEVADVILNPLGIPSRQNITQLLEAMLSYCAAKDDKYALVTPYNPNDTDFVRELGRKHNAEPKVMIDGRTGMEYPRRINCGILPMYKLHHVSKKKIHSVGMNAKIDSTFLQPTKGSKQNGGQSFGEMETWCLEAAGATTLLNELFTVQSDDVVGQKILINQQNDGERVESVPTDNSNNLAMQACYRSLFVEFTTDVVNGEYTFAPLRDGVIRALFPEPISTKAMLHSESIFGSDKNILAKAHGRDRWGWIDLHCEMIPPIWIYKGGLNRVIGLSFDVMKKVVQGDCYIRMQSSTAVGSYTQEDIDQIAQMGESMDNYLTGMEALVYVFKNLDTTAREARFKQELQDFRAEHGNKRGSTTEMDLLSVYKALRDFNESGYSLRDYVVTSMPVMPQTYRPSIVVAGRNVTPDFDWHYNQILNAASAVDKNYSLITTRDLFNAILEFTGLDERKKNKTYKNLLTFFCAKGQSKHHGKIRENIQSKRIMCSGRCAIVPAEDIKRTPMEIGVPFTMLVEMYAEQLYGFYSKLSSGVQIDKKAFKELMLLLALRDQQRFEELYERKFANVFTSSVPLAEGNSMYNVFTILTKSFLEGTNGNTITAVGAGRQPSLHKYSVRAFRPYVVYGNVAHIHPLLCKGYNADFDGDQMYFFAIQTQSAIEEALNKLSPAKDFILSKNGSIVLEHSQDIVLGVYAATMLQDNAVSVGDRQPVAFYSSLEEIKTDISDGAISYWDLVVYEKSNDSVYLSTAGRILFNALIPGAFTDSVFTNSLSIAGVKKENYKELQYDGIVGKSDKVSDGLRYFSLPSICSKVHEQYPSECISVYQAITEFGFIASDRIAVSLSLYDFDIENNKEEIVEKAEKLKAQIEQDFQCGLISAKDKRDAIIAIYGNSENGANTRILSDLLKHLPRNNNIFIMMDSGARGNKSQLMQMRGAVGILQKSKTEDLETSVTKNFYEGLSAFDVHLTSYSARTGVASTQNETKRSGYATHKVVYMASGIQIVESDCGNDDQEFVVEWGDRNPAKERFMPTKQWFDKYLLNRTVSKKSEEGIAVANNDGILTEESFYKLQSLNGFHDLELTTERFKADVFNASGSTAVDSESRRVLQNIWGNKPLTVQTIELLLKYHPATIETSDGLYTIRYDMTSSCRSLLTRRVAKDLPFLDKIRDDGSEFGVMTDKTIEAIQDNKINVINVRTTMRCKSKHGICAHCYGLKFSDWSFPEVGSFVGTDSAQSIAEPASQLTLDVINKGGAAGSSEVTSGVQIFDDLLSGGKQDGKMNAIAADATGYVKLVKLDTLATVYVIPEDRGCSKCHACTNGGRCPIDVGARKKKLCALPSKVSFARLCVKDGEFVKAGQSLTTDMMHPDSITVAEGCKNPIDLHVYKMRVWINNYYNIFKNSGISVYARHFELLAYVQNKYVTVLDSGTSGLQDGKVYEFNEVSDHFYDATIVQSVSRRNEVVLRNSGAFAALSFENVANVAANLVTSGYRENYKHNHSLIGSLSAGECLTSSQMKVFNSPKSIHVESAIDSAGEVDKFIVSFSKEESDVSESFSLDELNLDTIVLPVESFSEKKDDAKEFDLSEFTEEPEDDTSDFAEDEKQSEEEPSNYNNLKTKQLNAF